MDVFEALIRIAEAAAEKNREAQRSRAQAMYRAPVPPGSAPMPPVPPQVRQAQTPRVDPRVPQPQRVPVGKQRRGQRLAARRPPLIAPPPVPSSVATPIPATAPAPQPPPRPAPSSVDARALRRWLTPDTMRRQFILTEILQPPIALREERLR